MRDVFIEPPYSYLDISRTLRRLPPDPVFFPPNR